MVLFIFYYLCFIRLYLKRKLI